MKASLIAGTVALLLAGTATGSVAQGPRQAPGIKTIPAVVLRGSLARILVSPSDSAHPLAGIDGAAAGEPLHFEARGKSWGAVMAVPLESGDSLVVSLRLMAPEAATDTFRLVLPVSTPRYPNERLTVEPKFAKLDSATQARVDSEVSQARAVGGVAHLTPRLWRGTFAAPRPGRITSVFGATREFNGEVTSRHYGTDFAGGIGAPVRAAGHGVVALVANFYLAGHAVYVNHGAGLVTGYFHLSRVDVSEGDTVARGQVIGGVGRSGRATGPHLHWIARYGAITVDPVGVLEVVRP